MTTWMLVVVAALNGEVVTSTFLTKDRCLEAGQYALTHGLQPYGEVKSAQCIEQKGLK